MSTFVFNTNRLASAMALASMTALAMAPKLACAAPVSVPAMANIFGAGHATPPAPGGGGGGMLPPFIFVAACGPDSWVEIEGVAGEASCCGGGCNNAADGASCASGTTDILSTHGISGIIHNSRTMFLTGVFVGADEPMDPAPDRLDVSDANNQSDFFPALNQTFFMGDGLDSSGGVQRFHVPAGARRLYFGFADALEFGNPTSPPGFYGDNVGAISIRGADVNFSQSGQEIVWVGDQSDCSWMGGAAAPTSGPWEDGLWWQNFTPPMPCDTAILQTQFDPQGVNTQPHDVHFGPFSLRPDPPCSAELFESADTLVYRLDVRDGSWMFDFAHGFTPGADFPPKGFGSLTVLNNADIGVNNNASLLVRNTSTFTIGDQLVVGIGSSSDGVVTIDDGAIINASRANIGGGDGTGAIVINNGSFIDGVGEDYIGRGNGSGSGSVRLSGPNASWMAQSSIVNIGIQGGDGSIVVENGASLQSKSARIAVDQGSTGSALITGVGSSWTMGDEPLSIGANGVGQMTVADSATVSARFAEVGAANGSGEIHVQNILSQNASVTLSESLLIAAHGKNSSGLVSIGTNGLITCNNFVMNGDGSASLSIELSGNGLQGRLDVANHAHLGGALNIAQRSSVPSPGQSFPIITYAQRDGEFDTVTGLELPDDGVLVVSYTPTAVVVFRPNPDLNEDGEVNSEDLGMLIEQWGASGPADFDGDGAVSGPDIAFLLVNWGPMP